MDNVHKKLTRSEALQKGLTHYFTGKPCKYGHIDTRFTGNKTCKSCSYKVHSHKHKEGDNKYHLRYNKLYRLTPKGKAHSIWHCILKRVKNKDGKSRSYKNIELRITKQEFYEWIIPELQRWQNTKPIQDATIDRINTKGHYEMGNLQLLTRSENTRKMWAERSRHQRARIK